MDNPLVRLEAIDFSYGEGAFRLSIERLDLAEQEHVAFIGASGTGKTTLLHLIAGILVPERGRVTFEGQDLSGQPDSERRAHRLRHIGMVFQEFELLEYLSAEDNVLLPTFIGHGVEIPVAEVRRLARALAIDHVLPRRPHLLSQGERQRVALCRAMVTRPSLVIADEPTGNLDPDTARTILDLLFAQVKESNATLFMVTHDHSLLDRFDRVIDMRDLLVKVES